MEDFEFVDALTGDLIVQNYATGELSLQRDAEPVDATSIFFPGCSMINYAMPLVQAVYNTLLQHGEVDGISLLCCGKILSYEPNGDVLRPAFESQLRDHLIASNIKRIVCACPNCVKALREALALDERTKDIELAILPQVLADLGYRVDAGTTARLLKGDEGAAVLLCTHDSCPDREYGQFADGLRAILPEGLWADPAHCRRHSICCGSLPRAAGKIEAADKCADTCGTDAVAVEADAIVTACMSCTFQLNMAQHHVPAVHFLELLYDWRVNWASVGQWMKVRFLFDDTLGVTEREASSGRTYAGLSATTSDVVAAEAEAEGTEMPNESEAAKGVDISGDDVEVVGL